MVCQGGTGPDGREGAKGLGLGWGCLSGGVLEESEWEGYGRQSGSSVTYESMRYLCCTTNAVSGMAGGQVGKTVPPEPPSLAKDTYRRPKINK